MSRAEELTLKLVDGSATPEGMDELEWAIAADDEELAKHIALMQIEALLRGQRQDLDQARATQLALERHLHDKRTAHRRASDPFAAMSSAQPVADDSDRRGAKGAALRRKRSRRRRAPVGLYVMLVATIVLVAAAFVIRDQLKPDTGQPINHAVVQGHTGSARIDRGGTPVLPKAGSVLAPGNTVSTGANSTLTVLYDQDVRFDLRSDTEVTLADLGGALTRQINVEHGQVAVTIVPNTDSPTIHVATPHARVEAPAAQYSVKVTANRTRVSVTAGVVKVTGNDSGETLSVPAQHGAVVQAGMPLVARPLDATERIVEHLVALYRFAEGGGNTVQDISRVGTPMNLTIEHEGAVRWADRSLTIVQPTTLRTAGDAGKLNQMLANTGTFTFEIWLRPRRADQVAPILSTPSPDDPGWVNLAIEQGAGEGEDADGTLLATRLRTTNTGPEGRPALRTDPGTLGTKLVQFVWVRDADGEARYYLDGKPIKADRQSGALATWAPKFPLILANDIDGNAPWLGELRLIAIYNAALSDEQVLNNYNVGLSGALIEFGEDAPADGGPTKITWDEIDYMPFVGETRGNAFTVTANTFRIRYFIKKPGDTKGELVMRLHSLDNPDVVDDVVRTGDPIDGTYAAKGGPGRYRLIVDAPDGFEGKYTVEQMARQ